MDAREEQQQQHSATDSRVSMLFGSLGGDQVEHLRALGSQLRDSPLTSGNAGLQELALAVTEHTETRSAFAIGYSLAARPHRAFQDVGPLSAEGAAALKALKPAELLFHWEDDQRSPSDRGRAISELSIIPMTREAAAELRTLVRELVANHLDGLADMARGSGYYREAMALAEDRRGEPLFLLYLELLDDQMRARMRALPETPFTRWWSPRFRALLNVPLAERTNNIIRCTLTKAD